MFGRKFKFLLILFVLFIFFILLNSLVTLFILFNSFVTSKLIEKLMHTLTGVFTLHGCLDY